VSYVAPVRSTSEPFRRAAIGLVLTTALLATGCSEALRDVEGIGIKAVLERETASALEGLGITLAGGLDCNADVADDNSVTGSCGGTDTEGTGIASTLTGTVRPGDEEQLCTGTFVVKRGGETIVEDAAFDCLSE
jgi:hypothetical protein